MINSPIVGGCFPGIGAFFVLSSLQDKLRPEAGRKSTILNSCHSLVSTFSDFRIYSWLLADWNERLLGKATWESVVEHKIHFIHNVAGSWDWRIYGRLFIERNFMAAVETILTCFQTQDFLGRIKAKALAKMLTENDCPNCILKINNSFFLWKICLN